MQAIKANLQYKNSLLPLQPQNVQYIIIHHIASVKATPEQIHQWHVANGWSGAGYNEYITKDGKVYILRGDNVGAHCADNKNNYNTISYGIACEGDYDKEKSMPKAQFDSLIARIRFSQLRYKNATIVPHKKLTATTCPGQHFPWVDILSNFQYVALKFGSKGDQVKKAQILLNTKGYNCGIADGIYGVKTKTAVMNFQKSNNMAIDGIISEKVWNKLNCKCE